VVIWRSAMGKVEEEILRVLEEVILPLIEADGGELHLVSAEEDAVSLHLSGRYAGCPGNNLTRRQVIEPAIHAVAPKARVTVSSGVLLPKGARRIG
jgi:Fe-S cluster biogenesis protein NfuA